MINAVAAVEVLRVRWQSHEAGESGSERDDVQWCAHRVSPQK